MVLGLPRRVMEPPSQVKELLMPPAAAAVWVSPPPGRVMAASTMFAVAVVSLRRSLARRCVLLRWRACYCRASSGIGDTTELQTEGRETGGNVKRWPKQVLSEFFSQAVVKVPVITNHHLPVFQTSQVKQKKAGNGQWKCTLQLQWPSTQIFEAKGRSKQEAEHAVAELACIHLKELGYLDGGNPSLNESHEAANELQSIRRRFPNPKSQVWNCYHAVSQQMKDNSYMPRVIFKSIQIPGHGRVWECHYGLKWPSEQSFLYRGQSKSSAELGVALLTLQWLMKQQKLSPDKGLPILFSAEDKKKLIRNWQKPFELSIEPNEEYRLIEALEKYQELESDIKSTLESLESPMMTDVSSEPVDDWDSDSDSDVTEMISQSLSKNASSSEPTHPITGYPLSHQGHQSRYSHRNLDLKQNLTQRRRAQDEAERWCGQENSPEAPPWVPEVLRMKRWRQTLPILDMKEELLKQIEENRVAVVTGDTGCGKSSQLVQFLLDDWAEKGKGSECNIVVTQPRRISAVSLAKWVSRERMEDLGETVGYQVRLNSVLPSSPGAALFCTSGVLLRRLQDNPTLKGLSHVLVDEAHERDVTTDLLLVLLKRAVEENPSLHVAVMSATIRAELFADYLGGAPVVHVPGFTHPVKQHFLDDMDSHLRGTRQAISKLRAASAREKPTLDIAAIAEVVLAIDRQKPPGAILVFLPGWAEIKSARGHLSEAFGPGDQHHLVIPVHSRLSHQDQQAIFTETAPGQRKIVLATNVAETGITVPDVVYVVDSGVHKEQRLDTDRGVTCLDSHWITAANVRQRKGRAGRVQPGEAYHLFTRERMHRMDSFPTPEMLRIPLEKVVLDAKVYAPDASVRDFLSEALEAPSESAISAAICNLEHIGALEPGQERLTILGKRLAHFTTEPRLSKALILATLFGCLDPMLSVCALLSESRDFFYAGPDSRQECRQAKRKFHSRSDHLASLRAYHQWKELESQDDQFHFSMTNLLNQQSLRMLSGLKHLFAGHLKEAKLLDYNKEGHESKWQSCNRRWEDEELLKALLVAAVGTTLRIRKGEIRNGRLRRDSVSFITNNGHKATLSSDSVNCKGDASHFGQGLLFYYGSVQSQERRCLLVRDSSIISPVTYAFFSHHGMSKGKIQSVPVNNKVENGSGDGSERMYDPVIYQVNNTDHIQFSTERRTAELIDRIREAMWTSCDFLIGTEGVDNYREDKLFSSVKDVFDELVSAVGNILERTWKEVDSSKGKDGSRKEE